ncbi:MAG: MotA/TolQ/ExbB proton channel family protein [Burkholderiaceae bacterium]|nr:MotA/TolQ/ExbB proton channel family protein [Burkholderiaceae bacterium]
MHAFGLDQFWAGADPIIKGVALLLAIMSLASWYVIALKSLDLIHLRRSARHARTDFWNAAALSAAISGFGPHESAGAQVFAQLARAAHERDQHLERHAASLAGQMSRSDWLAAGIDGAIDDGAARLSGGMAVLASVSSTAPFIGLFGTVWGIYHALANIGAAGQSSLDKVAGPVGEALIMTALGLAVAIPAALGYNALVRANKSVLGALRRFGRDLHAFLLIGSRISRDKAEPSAVAMPITQHLLGDAHDGLQRT